MLFTYPALPSVLPSVGRRTYLAEHTDAAANREAFVDYIELITERTIPGAWNTDDDTDMGPPDQNGTFRGQNGATMVNRGTISGQLQPIHVTQTQPTQEIRNTDLQVQSNGDDLMVYWDVESNGNHLTVHKENNNVNISSPTSPITRSNHLFSSDDSANFTSTASSSIIMLTADFEFELDQALLEAASTVQTLRDNGWAQTSAPHDVVTECIKF
ncbi:hypothetical protein AALP_AA7G137900 [Arabis alpina]|uniref:Uncharacterized protein n=1 Tax=Arabis alpina TaxID=50452 RepID=A0A087GHW8_ARAAL|nr:hypothetical protein AALP_AA7G137900 [Arabis alpina]